MFISSYCDFRKYVYDFESLEFIKIVDMIINIFSLVIKTIIIIQSLDHI